MHVYNYFLKQSAIDDWLATGNVLEEVTKAEFIYTPKRTNGFSVDGERMVENLIPIGSISHSIFERILPIDEQKRLAAISFESLKGTKYDKPGKKGQRGYFRTERYFNSLLPSNYKRTPNAPRLTAEGNTFHGMNKVLLVNIVKEMTTILNDFVVLELDMSACHSRVAASLLPSGNTLEEALSAPDFWSNQTDLYIKKYHDSDIDMDKKTLKKIFKVALYTALNGGNPAGVERLMDNLMANAMELLPDKNPTQSMLYSVTKENLEDFQLLKEVKDLNQMCYNKIGHYTYTYTVDRYIPYRNSSAHKGISRVLQGFEVVLLSRLTRYVLETDGLPLSLDHDGLMAMYYIGNSDSTDKERMVSFSKEIEDELTRRLERWSLYLLQRPVPIETKRVWLNGEMKEF
jgi:hypothetical protein